MSSREIKFRSWDGIRMSTSGIMFNSSTGHLELPRVQQMHLMQYTGLKDKNGVEIYEGDIVKVEEYGMGKVVFIDGSFMVEWLDDDAYSMELSQINWKNRDIEKNMFEVIGNIYENPELLEHI